MKKSVSLSLVALILVALCAAGVFADSVSPLPIVSGSSYSDLVSGGFLVHSGSSFNLYASSVSSNTDDLFVGAIPSSNRFLYYCASKSSGQTVLINTSSSSVSSLSLSASHASGNYYVLLDNSTDTPSSFCPVFNSLGDFFSAVSSYSPLVGENVSYSIPSGYALVVEPSSGDVEIINRSYSISGSWSFPSLDYPDVHKTNGSIDRKLSSTYLVDGFSPDRVFGQFLIPWTPTNTNPSGVTSDYFFSDETDIVLSQFGETFVITNPVYYGYGDVNSSITRQNSVNIDVNFTIQYSSRPTLRLIAIESFQDLTNGQLHYYSVFRPDVYDEVGTPSVDGDTTIEVFPSAPSDGGNHGQPPLDDDTTLIGVIQRFTSRVRELFNSVSSAVQTLFSSGSTFMQRLADIFSWIPEPVSVVLVSALIIVVVVGLLKIFL